MLRRRNSAEVSLRILPVPGHVRIEVMDRGSGMNDAVLQNALQGEHGFFTVPKVVEWAFGVTVN